MTTISEQFIAIMPRHQRLLTDLWEQRKFDPFGGIGWRGLMDDDEMFTPEQLFEPLIERGLIEDLQEAHQSESGKFFVHITALGIMCMNFGRMLREPRKPSTNELKQITAEAKQDHEQRPQQTKTIEAGNAAQQAG
jgi:hypothetical protein